MRAVVTVVGRNLRLFFRDRMAVFFSLLAAVILFGLYTLFLGELQISDLRESFPGATAQEVRVFVDTWMFAGIVSMTAITTGLSALGVLVEDAASQRFRDLLVASLRPWQLIMGYFLAALIVSLTMTYFTFCVSLMYLWAADGVAVPFASIARSVGVIALSAAAFSAIAAFVTSFVKTPGAYATLSTIIGTVLGFLTGAYIPVGSFPESVQTIVTALPFAQASMLLRQDFAAGPLDLVVAGVPDAREPLRAYYGIDASLGEWTIPASFVVGLLVALTVVFTALGAAQIRGRVRLASSPDREDHTAPF